MPSMYEIYDGHAGGYDGLVSREDHEGNLKATLMSQGSWESAVVVEAGIGTGRVTRLYLDKVEQIFGFDRSDHMLARASENLADAQHKITLSVADHRLLPAQTATADVFIEGWAYGHAIMDDPAHAEEVAESLVAEAVRVLRPGGVLLLIESLGTNVMAPNAPTEPLERFYTHLEQTLGFSRTTISTDYCFDSREDAVARCGFFFGPALAEKLIGKKSGNGYVVPEFTGIWRLET